MGRMGRGGGGWGGWREQGDAGEAENKEAWVEGGHVCVRVCVFLPAEEKVCTWGGGWLRADSDSSCQIERRST